VIVFVHGVPETAAIWDGVRRAIGRDSVALGLPGFGTPRPTGFGATKDEYAEWLLDALDAIDGPLDLVGHDWGAPLVLRVAGQLAPADPDPDPGPGPDANGRLRSWVIDVANVLHPDYVWHQFAQVWQTPDEGEAFVAAQTAQTPEEQAPTFEGLGVPHERALEMAAASDATMGACILDLYRSATPNIHAEWGPLRPVGAPGLVIHATEDPFGDEHLLTEAAAALGAGVAVLDGIGHFWPYQAPEQAAARLTSFWSSLDDVPVAP
jgi:pimeloyl-ACP methyl ester carboxylesterase